MGYDISRFSKESIKDEFCCIICHDVLKQPKMLTKCEHIFCSDCIQEWFSCNGICPIDRERIKAEDLRNPMRSFLSLLGQLEISCDFASIGCNQIVKLEDLERHVSICEHNRPDLLKAECFCGKMISKKEEENHQKNCVVFLRKEIERISASVKELNKPSVQAISSIRNTVFQEWDSCDRQYAVVECEMNDNLRDEAIDLIKEGLDSGSNEFMTDVIKKLSEKYKNVWLGFVERIEYDKFNSYYYEKQMYLKIKVQSFHMTVFKIRTNQMKDIIEKARTVNRPALIQKSMNDSMIENAIQFSKDAINSHNSYTDISCAIQKRFSEKYKNNWNCFAGNLSYGFSYIKKQNHSVSMNYDNMSVIIWQCP